MLKVRHLIVALALACAAAVAVYAVYFRVRPAPAVTLTSIKGEKIGTADLRGRVVVVNFWATDCAICMKEMPRLTQSYRRFQAREFEMIAVAMPYDPPNYVIHYAEKSALPFKVALDPMGEITAAFGDVRLTPTTIVIDKRGNMVKRIVGEPDFSALEALIEQKLAETI